MSTDTLHRWTLRARRRLHLDGRIEIVVVRPSISQRWNKRYRRRDRPTNVLSFDYRRQGPHSQRPLEGTVLLCPMVIRREARQSAQPYRTRLKELLEHGLIHLLGLDHRTSAELQHWSRLEQRLV